MPIYKTENWSMSNDCHPMRITCEGGPHASGGHVLEITGTKGRPGKASRKVPAEEDDEY